MKPIRRLTYVLLVALLAGCGGVLDPVIPTAVVTPSVTVSPRASATPIIAPTETATPTTPPRANPTGGPSPTSIVGPTRTPPPVVETATPRPNPNAPRIDVFTSDIAYVYPGSPLTLFWSIRGADRAAIYRLDDDGQRNQLWNVEPSGSLQVQTARNDRGTADFLLTVETGGYSVEQLLQIPLLCAHDWFFAPAPDECAAGPEQDDTQIEQLFEGGRMIYLAAEDRVYVLFADGQDPAWTSFENRYVGGETADEDTNFVPPPGRYQPVRILGVVWRGSDQVRNRLLLGLEPEVTYEGAIQSDGTTVYIRSADGSVIGLEPNGAAWSVIAPP
jgi:hypothetical protein